MDENLSGTEQGNLFSEAGEAPVVKRRMAVKKVKTAKKTTEEDSSDANELPAHPEEGSDFCHRLVYHGREICTARTKPFCDRCCLSDICAKAGVEEKK